MVRRRMGCGAVQLFLRLLCDAFADADGKDVDVCVVQQIGLRPFKLLRLLVLDRGVARIRLPVGDDDQHARYPQRAGAHAGIFCKHLGPHQRQRFTRVRALRHVRNAVDSVQHCRVRGVLVELKVDAVVGGEGCNPNPRLVRFWPDVKRANNCFHKLQLFVRKLVRNPVDRRIFDRARRVEQEGKINRSAAAVGRNRGVHVPVVSQRDPIEPSIVRRPRQLAQQLWVCARVGVLCGACKGEQRGSAFVVVADRLCGDAGAGLDVRLVYTHGCRQLAEPPILLDDCPQHSQLLQQPCRHQPRRACRGISVAAGADDVVFTVLIVWKGDACHIGRGCHKVAVGLRVGHHDVFDGADRRRLGSVRHPGAWLKRCRPAALFRADVVKGIQGSCACRARVAPPLRIAVLVFAAHCILRAA